MCGQADASGDTWWIGECRGLPGCSVAAAWVVRGMMRRARCVCHVVLRGRKCPRGDAMARSCDGTLRAAGVILAVASSTASSFGVNMQVIVVLSWMAGPRAVVVGARGHG